MATRKKTSTSPASEQAQAPTLDFKIGLHLLSLALEEGNRIWTNRSNEAVIKTWFTSTLETLVATFGTKSGHIKTWHGNSYAFLNSGSHESFERFTLRQKLPALEAIINAGHAEEQRRAVIAQMSAQADQPMATTFTSGSGDSNVDPNSIFVVHGHDHGAKEACARVLTSLGLNGIILHEQPNEGRHILQKFKDHSEKAGYAIVLLTSDDKGYSKEAGEAAISGRARQNVIYELGFFVGSLGMDRVCVIYQDGVEMPSDLVGLATVRYEGGVSKGWKYELARELKAAGFEIDMNKV